MSVTFADIHGAFGNIPRRAYEAERPCESCGKIVHVRVIVLNPGYIAYLGTCGHDWKITCALPPEVMR